MSSMWDGASPGTLVDNDIIALSGAGKLITKGFNRDHVRQACYELSASEVFWEPASRHENKRLTISPDVVYILRPHTFVVCITAETIELPFHVMARILTKGQLFSIGVLPVNTYADPGFRGRLGITLFNFSNRYIQIRPGMPIAKIEFSVLNKPVESPYSGQHGYDTEIWPIPYHILADYAELKTSGQVRSDIDEIEASYGPILASFARRFTYYERRVWLHIGITVAAFLVLFAIAGEVSLVVSGLIGVVSNLATHLLVYLASRRRRWL